MTTKAYWAGHQQCEDCSRPAVREGLCEDHFHESFAQCDCCGKYKREVELIWCDSVGETYACPRCRGWEDE